LAFLGSVAGCFDNALAESVFLTLECGLFDQQPGGRFKNRQAKLAVFDYLETFYNPRRRHSASARSAPQRARTLRREPCGKSMSAETRCPLSKSTPGWASTTRSSLNRLWKIWTGFASWAS